VPESWSDIASSRKVGVIASGSWRDIGPGMSRKVGVILRWDMMKREVGVMLRQEISRSWNDGQEDREIKIARRWAT
jgi:hypothetical protein